MSSTLNSEELSSDELLFEKEESSSLEEIVTLESLHSRCLRCGYGEIKSENKAGARLTIYTRQGTKSGIHVEKRCKNYRCRTGYYHGFYSSDNAKTYDHDVLAKKYLLTSSQTAFEIQYLWDMSLQIHFSQASFESLSNIYNNLHLTNLPFDTLKKERKYTEKGLLRHITHSFSWNILKEKESKIL